MLIARGGYNPGGAVHGQQNTSGMNAMAVCTFCSIEEKIEIVEQAQLWMEETRLSLSDFRKVSKSMLPRWMKELPMLKQMR